MCKGHNTVIIEKLKGVAMIQQLYCLTCHKEVKLNDISN